MHRLTLSIMLVFLARAATAQVAGTGNTAFAGSSLPDMIWASGSEMLQTTADPDGSWSGGLPGIGRAVNPFATGDVDAGRPLEGLEYFGASATTEGNLIAWKYVATVPYSMFTLERSADGLAFAVMGTLASSEGRSEYGIVDDEPLKPVSYYRLKLPAIAGKESYSNVVAVKRTSTQGSISVWPLPVSTSLNVTGSNAGDWGKPVTVTDAAGHLVDQFTLSASLNIDVSKWNSGIYFLQAGEGETIRIVKK